MMVEDIESLMKEEELELALTYLESQKQCTVFYLDPNEKNKDNLAVKFSNEPRNQSHHI
jgi:hypothetical protein